MQRSVTLVLNAAVSFHQAQQTGVRGLRSEALEGGGDGHLGINLRGSRGAADCSTVA